MAVTIGEITVETSAPPPDKSSGQDASSGGAAKSGDVKKEIEKTLYHRESRARRLWDY
jgi:hypothetical protein